MKIKINKKEYEAKDGETILEACRRNGTKITTLCSLPEFHEGVCRVSLMGAKIWWNTLASLDWMSPV